MQDKELKTQIENVLRTYPDNEFSVEKIADVLRYHGSSAFKLIVQELAGLERDGLAVVTDDGKFQLNPDKQKLSGVFHANDKGFGFVAYDDTESDAYIAPDNTMNALNGDTVDMEIVKPAAPGSDRPKVRSRPLLTGNTNRSLARFPRPRIASTSVKSNSLIKKLRSISFTSMTLVSSQRRVKL